MSESQLKLLEMQNDGTTSKIANYVQVPHTIESIYGNVRAPCLKPISVKI